VPRDLRKDTSRHETRWGGAETQRAHDHKFNERQGKRRVRKERRTCMHAWKRRTRAEKVGRFKYIIQRIGRLEQKIDGIDLRTCTMMTGLREWMSFKSSYIQKVACQDEVDIEIIERLFQADDESVLPSTMASDLSSYGLRRWDVTRRIQRVNKKLRKELGKPMAEKRGHRRALSSFIRNAWACKKYLDCKLRRANP
jgi:hypothetical protein